jgi:hypothetical protein
VGDALEWRENCQLLMVELSALLCKVITTGGNHWPLSIYV